MELRPHQVEGVDWLRRVERGLLADSPRSGKTAQLLLAATGRTLVIAPPFLQGTWREEAMKWRPDLEYEFVGYQSIARRAPNAQGKMLRTEPFPREELLGTWDTVICDESHNLTNIKANWTQATARLKYDRLYLATGTPVAHWAQDILMTLRLLYPGDKRFTNRYNWLKRWFKMSPNPFSKSMQPYIPVGDPNLGLLDKWTWADFWYENGLDGYEGKMLQREVDLGVPVTEQVIEVPMTTSQAKMYKQLKKDYMAVTESGIEVSAWSDGGLFTKLAQCATGVEVLEYGQGAGMLGTGSGKLSVVRELLPESRRSPTLLFCQYRATAALLGKIAGDLNLRWAKIDGGVAQSERDRIRHEFQEGRIDVLIGTVSTVSVGLTLSRASTEIFVEHSWTPWKNIQARERAMEMGKKTPVHIIDLWTEKSVDIGMRSLVQTKTEQQIKSLSAREFRSLLDG